MPTIGERETEGGKDNLIIYIYESTATYYFQPHATLVSTSHQCIGTTCSSGDSTRVPSFTCAFAVVPIVIYHSVKYHVKVYV